MSQHKKQNEPLITAITGRGITTLTNELKLKSFLKAIYRDGATGTIRSLSKDVQTITDLFREQA